MAAAAPTPPQEELRNGTYASYVPHDLKYNANFEDEVMRALNKAPMDQDGIHIIPGDSSDIPIEGVSVKAEAISLQSLPNISEDELPLPLDDPRRIFSSPVPGIKLTHPGGYLHGGPGLDRELDTFAEDFLARNVDSASSHSTMRSAQTKEISNSIDELRERAQARSHAIERNERIEQELKRMREEHEMEMKVHRQLVEKRKAKKEMREREKLAKSGG